MPVPAVRPGPVSVLLSHPLTPAAAQAGVRPRDRAGHRRGRRRHLGKRVPPPLPRRVSASQARSRRRDESRAEAGRGRATRAEPGPRGRAPTAAHLGRGSRQRGHARRGDRMRRSCSRVACSLLLTLAGAGWAPRVAPAGPRLRLSSPPPSVLLLRRRRARVPTTSSSSSLRLLPSPPSSFPNQNTNTRVQRRNHFRRLRHVAARSKVRRVVTSAVAPYQRPREGLLRGGAGAT